MNLLWVCPHIVILSAQQKEITMSHETDLQSFPCPNCHEAGHLTEGMLTVVVQHQGVQIEAEGMGHTCGACSTKFMNDDMTESIANQILSIDKREKNVRLVVNRNNGEMIKASVH